MNVQKFCQLARITLSTMLAAVMIFAGVMYHSPVAFAEQLESLPSNAKQIYLYSVDLKNQNGNVLMSAVTDGPVGDYDWVVVYDHKPQNAGQPRGFDPNYLQYFYMSKTSSQQLSIPWQEGLYADYSSYDYKKGIYVPIVQAGPTQNPSTGAACTAR